MQQFSSSICKFCIGPQGSEFFSIFSVPVQNQPYCCDAPLEGNAKPPAENSAKYLQNLMTWNSHGQQTSWDNLTYTYHINQPDSEFSSVRSTFKLPFFSSSLVVVPWWWNASMVPPLKAIGPHEALQPMSFPDPVHQCLSALVRVIASWHVV